MPPPLLDDQALMEFGIVVMDALYHMLTLSIIYWNDGDYHEVTGTIELIDEQLGHIKIKNAENDCIYLKISHLKSVERM